ncbi:DUF3187 family protein [Hydrogenimonas sp.]
MFKFALSLLLFSALFLQADTFGPLEATIQHPARLQFYAPYPEGCDIADDDKLHVGVGLFQTNDYEKERHYFLDYGLATLQLSTIYAYGNRSEIRVILPVHHIYGGFMDNALDRFHTVTGTLNGSRHNLEGKNRVHIRVFDHDGSPLIDKEGAYTVLGNLQIEHKTLLPFHAYGIRHAVTVGIKIPLSKKKDGFSTEKVDAMAGWLTQKVWENDALFANFNVVKTGTYRMGSILKSKPLLYFAYLGYERRTAADRSWLFEYKFASSPYRSDDNSIDASSNVVDIVWRHRFKGNKLDVFISENLSPFKNTPDFTIGVRYGY